MPLRFPVAIFLLFPIGLALSAKPTRADESVLRRSDTTGVMPLAADVTQMWWADGFPSHTPSARWLRCVRTGRYGFVLNTETLQVPHFGSINVADADQAIFDLPAAELTLSIEADGKTFRNKGGGKWSRHGGPRVIASGTFLERADVTDLPFVSADGVPFQGDVRLETVAWPNRLSLVMAVHGKAEAIEVSLRSGDRVLRERKVVSDLPAADVSTDEREWNQVALAIDPVPFTKAVPDSPVDVVATEVDSSQPREVRFDASLGCHRINLDGVVPQTTIRKSPRRDDHANDVMERISLSLSNPSDSEQVTPLMFEKTAGGFRHNFGSPITGVSMVLRDRQGEPTGIPIQVSKNWHNDPEAGVHRGLWLHGITHLRLPPRSKLELELSIAYGHWGGIPAASHAQLSLIGWGSNQLWHETALGAWGESICFEPDQVQAKCTITDVRPMMVTGMNVNPKNRDGRWNWTHNVGGGDFFRLFDADGDRVFPSAVKAVHHRSGPCLTEVTFQADLARGIQHSATVSLARTDDLTRGIYRLRMDATRPTEFSRFVFFQVGADTYNYTREAKFSVGDASGLHKEWNTRGGGNVYRGEAIECSGRMPWASLHEGQPLSEKGEQGAWANRGIVIRSWKARLGGKDAAPWMAERGISLHRRNLSTLDLVPPPGITELQPGDFVEATIEHLVMPQYADDYYGPNEDLRSALAVDGNTWRMIHREAVRNDRSVQVETGELVRLYPDICIATNNNEAKFTLTGGIGYVPITFSGLASPSGHTLIVGGKPLDQSVHGNDYWQTDYDAATKRWSQTYNIPQSNQQPHVIEFQP